MAKFLSSRLEEGFQSVEVKDNVVVMNKSGRLNFRYCRAKVDIISDKGEKIKSYTAQRGVVRGNDGAEILAYFKKDGVWYVLLVEQYRIALDRQTLEAPGGEVHEADPLAAAVKELAEEIHLNIDKSRVKVVLKEWFLPSLIEARAHGGIVELEAAEVPGVLLAGEWQYREYTILAVRPLVEMLKLRDSQNHDLDLWLSRLLDEVAKAVGLLKKCY